MYMYIFLHRQFTKWAACENRFPQAVQKQPPVMLSHFHQPPAQTVLKNTSENRYRPTCIVYLLVAETDAISKVVDFVCHFVTYIVITFWHFALATL
jgi:hypothetical protein